MRQFLDKRTRFTIDVAGLALVAWLGSYVLSAAEKDPLNVVYTNSMEQYTATHGEVLAVTRNVCSTKDLAVSVHREFHNVETGKKFMLHSVQYVANKADGCYETEFSVQVPRTIPAGRYEYRPILIYAVNRYKTITKPAPKVEVTIEANN